MSRQKHPISVILVVLLIIAPVAWSQQEEVEVQSGDTLFGLVRLHYPNEPSRWSLIENEIFVNNPHAFSNNDKSSLRLGAILRLPVRDTPKIDSPTAQTPPEPVAVRYELATIGTIVELSGIPLAIDINNEQRPLNLNDKIYRGDAVLTEGDSAVHLRMNDGAQLFLRAGSRIVIDDYTFFENDARSSRSLITLLKGGFRAITGLIARDNPGSVRINTVVATIGVRGTDFAVRSCGPDDCSLPGVGTFAAGDYSGVLGGEITITNDAGTTPVMFGEIVHTANHDTAPVPAPEAAALIFTESELALLTQVEDKPMNFFQWLRSVFSRKSSD